MKNYKISEICIFEKKTKRRASLGKPNGKFKFFTSSPYQSKFLDSFDFEGDYIIIGTGGVANIHFFNDKFSASADCLVLNTNRNIILTKYLYYFFKRNFYLLKNGFKGAGLKHISKEYIERLIIPVPDLSEQQKIISLMDTLENLITERQKANKQTKNFLYASYFELFGNPLINQKGFKKVNLSEIVEINPSKSEIKDVPLSNKISFIEMASVSNEGKIINKEERNIQEVIKGFTYFKNGDVLFAKITPCMENGKGAIAQNLQNGIGFGSTEFHILRPNNKVLKEWLFVLTKLKNFRDYCKKNMTGTAGQKRVPKTFLEEIEVFLPPIELQEKFKIIYNKVIDLEKNQKESESEINNAYNTLLQKQIISV
jgi:type I restriction enzyme S subunit